MAANDTKIIGMENLEAALRDIGPMIQGKKGYPKNPLRNASRAMATVVKNAAIAKAPEDTGRLKRAITSKLLSTKYRDQATMRGDSSELYYVGIKTGNGRDDPKGAYYGPMVETGTDKQPAQPFLRPAMEENRSKLPSVFEAKLGKDINAIAKKLNKPI